MIAASDIPKGSRSACAALETSYSDYGQQPPRCEMDITTEVAWLMFHVSLATYCCATVRQYR